MITPSRYTSCLATGVLVAIFVSSLYLVGSMRTLQYSVHDPLFGGGEAPSSILIVAIDDKSLQEIGRWPWNRSMFSKALPLMRNAQVIGFDVAFAEPTQDDALFSDAIRSNNNIVLPVEFSSFQETKTLNHLNIKGIEPIFPVPLLREASKGLGIIHLITDDDGITRAAHANIQTTIPLFAQALAGSNTTIPRQNRLLIHFIGSPGTFETISFTDVIHKRIKSNTFDDAIVLIGATSPDLHDTYFVPTSHGKQMAGVEVHANLLYTILSRSYLIEQPAWALMFIIFVLCLLVSLIMARFHAWASFGILAGILVLYLFLAIWLFDRNVVMDLVFAPLGITLTYISNLVNLYLGERKHKKQIFDAFNKYVSPTVILELLKHPDRLKLGGEQRTITIFFSDIRGFTTISEKLSPTALVELLNEYLSAMTDIIITKEGVIDKYMGDAIMAFWGAPLDQPDHAFRACSACLDMMDKLHSLQIKWREQNIPTLDIGIGLNTGPAVVGNMGSTQRFDYTCMGDTVNLGSRLEGLNKEYGTNVIISQSTRNALMTPLKKETEPLKRSALKISDQHSGFVLRELDFVRVKGKLEPVTIYELVGRTRLVPPQKAQAIHYFEKGLALYRKQSFKAAMKAFNHAVSIASDKTAGIYLERCRYFLTNPPGKDWDGVWVMKTK